MLKIKSIVMVAALAAGTVQSASAAGTETEVIVGPDDLQNFACFVGYYQYPLQYFVGRIKLEGQVCTGTLINSHNGILTDASCIPPTWRKSSRGTIELLSGVSATCDPDDDEPLPGFTFSVSLERVSPLGVALLRGGPLDSIPGNPTPSSFLRGANLDDAILTPPNSPAVLVGFQGAVKKLDSTCEVLFWDGLNGVHTCDTIPSGTAKGSPLYRDYGPSFPFFSLPVMGIDVGEDPNHPGFNLAVPIWALAESGFLDGEIDLDWH